ncbi:LpqV protein [Mycolicibacterium mageritense DSM 44476 = CIP 104973]|uniref:LpqV protein n=1 Tax=Mycolicibacterium mageritense TaxID=53462 RepID=A0ABN5XZC6_MYCME|nr:lipoprotein LpqV [Mycolicibacterium mageritense]MCC9182433.1 lipoprotein LpqV [Mycolicibacterium mageritense]BBX31340.1 LpqV protein [Mycolicibacterium mageritense]CDO25086.1 LpqV protein [Mycolicibacterium mageritense DSM 44476 = CIP 104973]
MRSYPWATRLSVAVIAASGLSLLTGCNSSAEEGKPAESSSAAATTTTTTAESSTPTAAPGEVAVSPGGVTTAVGADAQSTEDEYFQACHAAKVWMDEKGGDPKAQIEPYLASLQAPGAAPGPGTYNVAWAQLEPARQAAVIVAVRAAADELCS